jgi:hypothetical protein
VRSAIWSSVSPICLFIFLAWRIFSTLLTGCCCLIGFLYRSPAPVAFHHACGFVCGMERRDIRVFWFTTTRAFCRGFRTPSLVYGAPLLNLPLFRAPLRPVRDDMGVLVLLRICCVLTWTFTPAVTTAALPPGCANAMVIRCCTACHPWIAAADGSLLPPCVHADVPRFCGSFFLLCLLPLPAAMVAFSPSACFAPYLRLSCFCLVFTTPL